MSSETVLTSVSSKVGLAKSQCGKSHESRLYWVPEMWNRQNGSVLESVAEHGPGATGRFDIAASPRVEEAFKMFCGA